MGVIGLIIVVVSGWVSKEIMEIKMKKVDENFEKVGKDIKMLYEWNEAITNEIDKLCRLIGEYRKENKELRREIERKNVNKDDV